jgi:hypothetical protein
MRPHCVTARPGELSIVVEARSRGGHAGDKPAHLSRASNVKTTLSRHAVALWRASRTLPTVNGKSARADNDSVIYECEGGCCLFCPSAARFGITATPMPSRNN